ncbi:unnamed protein product [Fusarium equiseti]|uniref:Uncharacterized protein n=1 Tax=Fusarium equiseti TaxID=61235 RepID=A0A8J2IZ36_FUSEQ|nr:unnamed protein product [Fusarium equiseti]
MTKKIDACQLVRGALGSIGQQFISKAGAMCQCLPKALDIVTTTAFDSIKTGSDISASVSRMIGEVIELQKCMMDSGFHIKDNKADVMARDLSSQSGWVVITAAEIDLATYGKFAAAISPCIFAACEPELIRSFFTNFLSESNALMSKQLTAILEGWIDVFQKIEGGLLAVVDASEALVAHSKTIPAKIKNIEEKVCKKSACLGPVIAEFMRKVSEGLMSIQAFADAQKGAEEVVKAVPQLVYLTRSAIDITHSIPDMEDITNLIISGRITKIQDIVETIQITKELPKIVKDLQDAARPILNVKTKLQGGGEKTLALLQDIVSSSWDRYPFEFTTDANGDVRASVQEIQNLIRDDLEFPLQNVTSTLRALDDIFKDFPIKKGQFDFQAGVSSYSRWSMVSMHLPCTRQKTARYEVAGGFKGSFSYPEIYACPFGPRELPWPNHHIPYFKFRLA